MANEFVTVTQAAAELGMNRIKFARRIKDWNIPTHPSVVDRRAVLIQRSDLADLKQAVEREKAGTVPQPAPTEATPPTSFPTCPKL